MRMLFTDPSLRTLYADWEESPAWASRRCAATTPNTPTIRN